MDEEKLAMEILAKEKQLADEQSLLMERENQMADSIAKGIQYKPDRSADPANPPETLDIVGNLDNKKMIKLSDMAKGIQYIILEPPPDSLFFHAKPIIHFTKTNIIATSRLATCIYSLSGQFLDMVCKTDLEAPPAGTPGVPPLPDIPYFRKYNDIPKTLKDGRKRISGWRQKGIDEIYSHNSLDKTIYFKYTDKLKEKSILMKYEMPELGQVRSNNSANEKYDNIISKGEPLTSLDDKSTYHYHILNNNSKIGYQSLWNSAQNGVMLLVENIQGDTICVFEEYDRIFNYDAKVVKSFDEGSQYFFNNQFTYRGAINDTIFRFIPPNRLLPVFILNLGKYKPTVWEAIHPRYSLKDKFQIKSWVETPRFIFIKYIEGYSSLFSLKKKEVKFYYAWYDKKLKQLNHIPVDPLNYVYEIENDIDGGLPLWPEQANNEGIVFRHFEGWELKKHINSQIFKQSNVSHNTKENLINMAKFLSDAESVVMIIE